MSLCDAMCVFCFDVFFFKQKTAYEMRISDWSSDVCSSDLSRERAAAGAPHQASRRPRTAAGRPFLPPSRASSGRAAAPPRPSPIAAFRGATASCEGSCPETGGKPLGSAQRQRETGERRVLERAEGEEGASPQQPLEIGRGKGRG